MARNGQFFTLPNTVSCLRLLLAPIALGLAIGDQANGFLITIAVSVFTDLLDGFLARSLHQITALGSKLDSWGDFAIYSTMAVGAVLLWPDTVLEYRYICLAIIFSFTVPTLFGLFRYHSLTSYHTWSVKLAVAATIISYVLLFGDIADWPIYFASALCTLAALEEIAISILLSKNTPDVRSLYHASMLRKKNSRAD